jgi:hypothetical protein
VANYLSEEVAVEIGVTTANGASGTSDITGVTTDMAGFDGIMAVVAMGPITSGAVTSIKWQQGADSAMGDAADLLASGQPIYDTDDNKVFYTDLIKPQERYVRIYVDRATQAATVGSVVYLKYRASRLPVTHGSNVSGEQLTGLAEGNAVISSTSPSASLSPSASASPSSSASPSA